MDTEKVAFTAGSSTQRNALRMKGQKINDGTKKDVKIIEKKVWITQKWEGSNAKEER